MTAALAIASGGMVGFVLGLVGGGGSIIAAPLLLYVVGIADPHVAIGTGALAVTINAFACFTHHWRAGNVQKRTAAIFAAAGVPGALVGSSLGKSFDGHRLLFLFALVMIIVAASLLRAEDGTPRPGRYAPPPPTRASDGKVAVVALCVGALSGFFGIGGGFLIVPGLILATGMELIDAIGTSLFAVGVFGAATAANYTMSGLIDWPVALEYIGGGLVGGHFGMRAACLLAHYRGVLKRLFAFMILCVALYMLWETGHAWISPTHEASPTAVGANRPASAAGSARWRACADAMMTVPLCGAGPRA